ncbi:phage tail assembly chaperone G [Bacillus sp. T33-2]|uniref:phage tail assembly chaperone G n=1 Tax=Bacillus sp. T33-2 TaxID=2054168 RepID=UPI000C777DF9|nr:hypothetical protein [Bacillus sp. T33-2]PLR93190.1 hypothetical protein CVD19_19480 [Bacillus sp. T33-2]
MKTITLFIDGEEKKFVTPFVSGLIWRNFIELKAKTKDPTRLTVEELDKFAALVPMAFGNQFNLDQFWAGIPHDKVMLTIDGLFSPDQDENQDEDENGDAGNEKK